MNGLFVNSGKGGKENRRRRGQSYGCWRFDELVFALYLILFVLQEMAFIVAATSLFLLCGGVHRAVGHGCRMAAFRRGKEGGVLQLVAAIVLVDQQSGRTE